jgi:hypothetical protein
MSGHFSVDRKVKCLDREIGMRRALYPSFVRRGKMSEEAAAEEIAVLEAIRNDYEDATVMKGD